VLLQGTDSLLSLTRWHRYRDLLEAVPIVALTRPGFSPEEFDAGIREHIHILEMPNLDISATLVRERRRSGRSIRYLVPPEVEELIHRRGLYLS
jgi:nicotinate-nucleotide adenylyltransferase